MAVQLNIPYETLTDIVSIRPGSFYGHERVVHVGSLVVEHSSSSKPLNEDHPAKLYGDVAPYP